MSSSNGLSVRPPMGWNSWDCFAQTITEKQLLSQATFMAGYLKAYGYEYVVIDAAWSESDPQATYLMATHDLQMDEWGRVVPCVDRFPSAVGGVGFRAIADRIHAMGLKFGVHIMRGIPRRAVRLNLPVLGTPYRARDIADTSSVCTWCTDMFGIDMAKPGAQAYYDSLIQLYAEWGLDFIKADDMASPYYSAEVEALARARDRFAPQMVLSLSPGDFNKTAQNARHAKQHSEMWRISPDFWDEWAKLRNQFPLCRLWAEHSGPGHWPDADMIPIGRLSIGSHNGKERNTGFTREELYTLMSLWAIFRSPLMVGGSLLNLDDFELGLLTNPEVLAVNQEGSDAHELFQRGNAIAWVSTHSTRGDRFVGLFNLDDTAPLTINVTMGELGLPTGCHVRDLWDRRELGRADAAFAAMVPPHGGKLFRVGQEPLMET